MGLRNSADWRSLVWAFGLFPLLPVVDYVAPGLAPYLLPLGLYLGFCAGVLTHNHNHRGVFASARANRLYSLWLSFFYGTPVFTWIPTHNQNHHRYLNGSGDVARTSRHTQRDTLWRALSYPFASGYWQSKLISEYVSRVRRTKPRRMRQLALQYVAVYGGHAAALGLAVWLYGWGRGALVYGLGLGIPAFFATWSMMFTNYLQHVDCDPSSPHNHSRNFVAPLANWFVFHAGYHTVHHEHPGAHWSELPTLHAARAGAIEARLNQDTIVSYCVRQYLLGWLRAGAPRPAAGG